MARSISERVIILCLSVPGTLASQQPVDHLTSVSCGGCVVTLSPTVTLGQPQGPGLLISDNNQVVRDSRGRYYVYGSGPTFWVFSPNGTFLTTIGRDGEGPGEFRDVSGVVIARGDSVTVFDAILRRMTVYSPTYQQLRTRSLDYRAGIRSLAIGSQMVVNTMVRTPDRVGYPLQLLDRDGLILRSFGSETGEYRADLRDLLELRQISWDGTAVWSGWVNQYVIERWGLDGRLLRTLRRDVEWFPTWWQPLGDLETPPVPVTAGLQVQGDTLWVLINIPAPTWKSAIRPSGRAFRIADPHDYQHTMVEAIDLRRAQVLVSTRIPMTLSGFAGPGQVFGAGTDPAGNPTVRVWNVEITRR